MAILEYRKYLEKQALKYKKKLEQKEREEKIEEIYNILNRIPAYDDKMDVIVKEKRKA